MDLNRARRMLKCLIPYSPHGRRIRVVLTVLIAAFAKSERGSLPQTPNNTAQPNSGEYTTSMTEQVSNNLSREYLNETIYPDPGSFLPVLETDAPQCNPNDTVAAISVLQPSISHIPTTSTVSVPGDLHIQPSAPGSTVPITVPENVIPQTHEPSRRPFVHQLLYIHQS
ncbi:hypothetical protein BJX66DRAFT_86504 [Aspergillus keveii]|uniref:Uncharacterized protein n=1 Tax=Aspergillus keveii TaxID=714993 RepID=A0ABR4GEU5_9EURO